RQHRVLHSFPTRRSSDLVGLRYVGHATDARAPVLDGSPEERAFIAYYLDGDRVAAAAGVGRDREMAAFHALVLTGAEPSAGEVQDRKSTRLNSSHVKISY